MKAPAEQRTTSLRAYAGARALVLGGAGFIGAWVTRALVRAGADVYAVVRDRRVAEHRFSRMGVILPILECDLAESGRATSVLAAVGPAVVFNLASRGVERGTRDPDAMYALNARLVSEVCDGLAHSPSMSWPGVRLVHVGSSLEYGVLADGGDEGATPRPTVEYGQTKLMGTTAVREAAGLRGLKATTARLFNVYGPGEPSSRLLPTIFRAARTSEVVPLTDGLQQRDFAYVEDVAEGLLRLGLANVTPGEVVHLATGRLTMVRSFAELAAEISGVDPRRLAFGSLATDPQEVRYGRVSVARLQALTGWRPPTTVTGGIRRAWEHGVAW